MSGLTTQPAVALLAMLQRSEISPPELAAEFLREIERWNPTLRALVDVDPERVLEEAQRLARSSAPRGPLFGLPVTVKASISAAGYRCEIGSRLHRGEVPRQDATVVARLRQAGALLLGTTNCPEFLMAYETDNLLYGRTANPWDLERSAGGSSGGEAAAIAAGLSAGGLGSDGGGSVRQPAHFTGICALKPTPGRIPATGHLPPCTGPFAILGAIGPMARTVADLKLFFATLSGQDPLDPAGAPVPLRKLSRADCLRVPIGFLQDDGLIPVTAETRQAVTDAARSLERMGFHVRPFASRWLERARELWWKFFVRCGAMLLEPETRQRQDELSPIFREFLGIAHRDPPLTGQELLAAWTECDIVRAKLLEEMRECPILLTPVCSVPAFRHLERSWMVDGRRVEYLDAMRFTQWFNLLGSPAAVAPVGRSPEGLPIGVQVAGRPFEDELVLEIASMIEASYGYRPPKLGTRTTDPSG